MRKTGSFAPMHRVLPPPLASKSPFFALLFAIFKASFQIFKASRGLKLTTLMGQSDHFEGSKWSLSKWNFRRTVAKLGFFTWPTRFSPVQNRGFWGCQIAKRGVKRAF